jgi:hypothetical protein
MHSIITIADVNIYVIRKSKRYTLKIFQHVSDHIGSVIREWSVFGDICHQTPTTHIISTIEPLYVISVKYRFSLPDDGSYVIRNMLE